MRGVRSLGFTLIELMVVMTVVVILVITAAPGVTDWLQNAKTRSMAESVQNGLRFAQTEAARLSRQTAFTATATDWTVTYTPLGSDATPNPLQTSPVATVAGVALAASFPVVQFSSLGRASGAATAAGPFTPLAVPATYDVTNSNGSRRLRVSISEGGKIRMCDPDKSLTAATPDGCAP